MADRLQVVIDTREQVPWAFNPAHVNAEIGTLKTADYALAGDRLFGIERKSLDDFLGTISSGWERFNRELDRMEAAQWVAKVVIVEGQFSQCCFMEHDGELIPPQHRHPMLSPQFVMKRIAELTLKNCSVLFARDAHLAAALAVAVFRERKRQIESESETETKKTELEK